MGEIDLRAKINWKGWFSLAKSASMQLNDCLAIVRDIAPYDTGNLAFNAIKGFTIPQGFRIEVSDVAAPYGEKLDKGIHSRKHIGWFTTNARSAIGMYLAGNFGDQNSINNIKERIGKLAKDNPARQQRLLESLASIKEE